MTNIWLKEDSSNIDWKSKYDLLLQEYEQSIKDFAETMEKSYEEAYAMILDLKETVLKLENELTVCKKQLLGAYFGRMPFSSCFNSEDKEELNDK